MTQVDRGGARADLREWMVRRQTHRSRALTSVLVGTFLTVLLGWLALETLLFLIGLPPVLARPQAAGDWLADLPATTTSWALVISGLPLALLGLALLWIGLGPGPKAKRALESERAAVVTDDTIVANAVAKVAQSSARVPANHVAVRLGGSQGTVDIRPNSGLPIDREAVREAVSQELQRWRLPKELHFAINVQQRGVVEA